jgi:hypothetical protein
MIVFPGAGNKHHVEAFTTRMLGLPKFNGHFDFSRPELNTPRPFPQRRPGAKIIKTRRVGYFEQLDPDNVILSKNKIRFNIVGTERSEFSLPSPCKELVVRNGEAYLLTEKLLCVYKKKAFRIYRVEALSVCSSPFNEMILLLKDRILIFDGGGLTAEYPFEGEIGHIQCYMARELIAADNHNVYHVNLLTGGVRLLCTTSTGVVKLVVLDRLYILEDRRVTMVNIEDQTTQSMHIERYMSLEIGRSLLAVYLLSGEFYFCNRYDLSNNHATIFDAPGLLSFKFAGNDSLFYFDDRVVVWSSAEKKIVGIEPFGIVERRREHRADLPDDPGMLEEEYISRKRENVEYRSNGVYEKVK